MMARSLMQAGRGLALVVTIFASANIQAEPSLHALLMQADEQLSAWDIGAAHALLTQLEARAHDAPESAWLRGRVAFEEGDYDAATRAFESAKAQGVSIPSIDEDLRLAKNAGEEVRGAPVVESAHFLFRAKAEKDRILAPYALDALEKAYSALTQDLGYQPDFKIRVEIYDSAKALARVSPLTVEDKLADRYGRRR